MKSIEHFDLKLYYMLCSLHVATQHNMSDMEYSVWLRVSDLMSSCFSKSEAEKANWDVKVML